MSRTAESNLRGSLFMVSSMAGFAVEDMFLKSAAKTLPLGPVLFYFGILGLLTFIILTRRRGEAVFDRDYLSPPLLVRAVFEVTGRLFYALAFVLIPLTIASAILQATPLVVMAGAALLLGEKVGWRRWAAVGVGLSGVIMILRPGLEGYDALSLLAVVGMIGFAGRDLATRAAPLRLSNMQLGICGFAMLSISGLGLSIWQGGLPLPEITSGLHILGATVFGVAGYYYLTVAMRTGEVGAVTPWRYTRLIFAMILGALVFGERPDALTILGSALIIGSGTFVLIRSRKRG